MDRLTTFLQEKVMPTANKIANQRHLAALRDAMVLTIPFIIIGSLFLILASFPIPAYTEFLANHGWLREAFMFAFNATFNIVALIATIGLGYRLGESYSVDPISTATISLASFFVVTPNFTATVADATLTGISTSYFSSQGMFVGLVCAIISTEIYRFIIQKDLTIKMPDGVPPTVSKSFTSIVPGFFVIVVMVITRMVIENFTGFDSVYHLIQVILELPLRNLGTSLIGTIFVFLIINLLWCIGLHGSVIANSVMLPVWLQLTSENAAAHAAGEAIPNIVSAEFRYLIFVGGSGATLGLVIAMLFFAKSDQLKQLGKLGILPGIFGINEPVLFGFPIVFNPIMWIPFLIMPVVTVLLTYLSMQFGLVHMPIGVLPPGTTPPLIGGYLMTGSLSGSVLQLVILIVSFLVYFPFFKMVDRQKYNEEQGVKV
ncbi:PTS cellobiose transporter subunit IIC [Fundicoccus culcitae]|uniref:Permease IIC component n=1 Tax=Fundicoccus culcitae TaxID=2969821 RepID=A0ABY5P8X2_9LACT|nr:PTS cellobiose transporter subunit IIC [Fundicoccus culcitae]UUX35199.1 PTS cellobiose transporter subunit IIC [Fundicoccus culcitae]